MFWMERMEGKGEIRERKVPVALTNGRKREGKKGGIWNQGLYVLGLGCKTFWLCNMRHTSLKAMKKIVQ